LKTSTSTKTPTTKTPTREGPSSSSEAPATLALHETEQLELGSSPPGRESQAELEGISIGQESVKSSAKKNRNKRQNRKKRQRESAGRDAFTKDGGYEILDVSNKKDLR
jgi:hypothetical protein